MASFEKRGKKWRAVVSATDLKGVRKKVSKTFDTKKEATVWATEQENKSNNGFNILSGKTMFPDYFEEWVEVYRRPTIRESTYTRYQTWVNTVKDIFDGVELQKLSNYHLQQVINKYGETHSLSVTRGFLVAIRSSLKDALLDGHIDKDIFSRLKATSSHEVAKIENYLSAEEFTRLQAFLYDNADRFKDNQELLVTLISLETGARFGEIYALRTDDIFDGKLKIDESYAVPTRQYTLPKTPSSIRTIRISNKLETTIKKYIDKTGKDDLLFSPKHRTNVSRKLTTILKHANVHQIRFHGLRHSHVSYLLHNNVDISYISKRVGHSNTKITLEVYAHLLKEKEQEQEELVLDILSNTN